MRPTWEERQREERLRGAHWVALLVQALRQIGARSAYCRYDGGNDEGFAWLDYVELRNGERLSLDEVAARVAGTDLLERIAAAGLSPARGGADEVRSICQDVLAIECAVMLLGSGFGTGPYWLYGAFTVDLEACTIVDDRHAEPKGGNINIKA